MRHVTAFCVPREIWHQPKIMRCQFNAAFKRSSATLLFMEGLQREWWGRGRDYLAWHIRTLAHGDILEGYNSTVHTHIHTVQQGAALCDAYSSTASLAQHGSGILQRVFLGSNSEAARRDCPMLNASRGVLVRAAPHLGDAQLHHAGDHKDSPTTASARALTSQMLALIDLFFFIGARAIAHSGASRKRILSTAARQKRPLPTTARQEKESCPQRLVNNNNSVHSACGEV